MVAIVATTAYLGLEARGVEVQCQITPGVPRFIVVGLPDTADYQAKLSGLLLDRIDLHVEVQAVSAADLVLPPPAEGSAEVAARVAAARGVQTVRYTGHKARTNAEIDGELLEAVATPDEAGRKLLAQAAEAMRLSARG